MTNHGDPLALEGHALIRAHQAIESGRGAVHEQPSPAHAVMLHTVLKTGISHSMGPAGSFTSYLRPSQLCQEVACPCSV